MIVRQHQNSLCALVRPSKRPTNQHLISFNEKVFKATQKGQKYKCQFTTFKMDFFENFCIFGILRYGFPNKISISKLLGHFDFWPLCYGGLSAFLTGLAL